MDDRSDRHVRSGQGTESRLPAASEALRARHSVGRVHRDEALTRPTVGAPGTGRRRPPEDGLDVPGLLAQLPALEEEIEAGERRLREYVRLLRAHRATWREIGEALQVSRQAAWERFGAS